MTEIPSPETGPGHSFLPSHTSLHIILALIFTRIIPNEYKWGPIIAIREVSWDVLPSDLKNLQNPFQQHLIGIKALPTPFSNLFNLIHNLLSPLPSQTRQIDLHFCKNLSQTRRVSAVLNHRF